MLVTKLPEFLKSIPCANTREAYRRALLQFDGKELTGDGIRAWVEDMRERALTEKTVSARLSALRSYLTFMRTPEAKALREEVSEIRVKPTSKAIYLPADSDVEQAISKSQKNHLDHLLLLLLVDEGLRVSEAVSITAGNVSLKTHTITFQRKGGNWQTLPISRRCEEALAARLAIMGQGSKNARVLPMTTNKGREIVHRYFSDERVHPHTLRHVAGTRMLRKEGNLALVQKFLGHKSPNTTALYTHLVNDDLARAIRG